MTVCTAPGLCLSRIAPDGAVHLTPFGEIVQEEWERTAALRPNVRLDVFVIMPDHIHGILWITEGPQLTSVPGMDDITFGRGMALSLIHI